MKTLLPKKEYFATLATKHVGVDVVFFDEEGSMLIVKPSYRDGWQVPGGAVDENESPKAAALREIQEEIALELPDLTFLCVEYTKAHDEYPDFLEFVFFGGVLTKDQVASVMVDKEELEEFRFVALSEVFTLLRPSFQRRLPQALEAMKTGVPVYTEF